MSDELIERLRQIVSEPDKWCREDVWAVDDAMNRILRMQMRIRELEAMADSLMRTAKNCAVVSIRFADERELSPSHKGAWLRVIMSVSPEMILDAYANENLRKSMIKELGKNFGKAIDDCLTRDEHYVRCACEAATRRPVCQTPTTDA